MTEDTWIDGSSVYEITIPSTDAVGFLATGYTILDYRDAFTQNQTNIPYVGEAFTTGVAKLDGIGWLWGSQPHGIAYMKVRYIKSVLT